MSAPSLGFEPCPLPWCAARAAFHAVWRVWSPIVLALLLKTVTVLMRDAEQPVMLELLQMHPHRVEVLLDAPDSNHTDNEPFPAVGRRCRGRRAGCCRLRMGRRRHSQDHDVGSGRAEELQLLAVRCERDPIAHVSEGRPPLRAASVFGRRNQRLACLGRTAWLEFGPNYRPSKALQAKNGQARQGQARRWGKGGVRWGKWGRGKNK